MFKPGESGNPAGRPKGSRNKLSERFISDLHSVWEERGIECLIRMAEEKPDRFAQMVSKILPRDFQVTVADEQGKWVLNAQPALTTEEWQEKHGLLTVEKPKTVS